jgi:hypothetical protein
VRNGERGERAGLTERAEKRGYDMTIMSDNALWTTYANTVLRIGPRRQLKVDLRQPLSDEMRRLLTEFGPAGTFAIITPFNPGGRRAHAWVNQWRYLRLRARLASSGRRFVDADGESPDASHRERGFAIATGRGEAAALARELEQLALYWFDGDAFWVDAVLEQRPPQRLPSARE